MAADKYEVLKRYFGYSSFRNGQEEVVDALLSRQDVLGIMPNGTSKQELSLLRNQVSLLIAQISGEK